MTCDVTIVGARPYGLAATAHLRAIKGLEVAEQG
jgi:ribulose 1,5-bisphosphate synthetase/thiazole synthase